MKSYLSTFTRTLVATTALAGFAAAPAMAATTSDTFGVSATVVADCEITTPGSIAFGTDIGTLTTAVEGSGTISVTCTNTTTYDIGLGVGANGVSETDRKMLGGVSAELLDYALYSDSGRSANWGDTVDTDTVAGTGTGSAVDHTVYGEIPVQPAVTPDSYTDTVTITVTY